MSNQNENDVVSCPYNRSHKVVRSRLLWHIQKCKAPQTIKSQFGHCKYNYLHIIEKTALSMHEDCECIDRPKKLERRDDCGEEGLKDEAFKQWKKQQNKEKKGKKLNNVHEAPSEIQNEPLDFEVASNLQQSQVNESNMSVLLNNIEQSRLDSTLEVDQSQSELNLTWLKNNDNKAKRGYKPTNLLENLVKEEDQEDLDSDQQEDSDEEEIQMKKTEEIKKKKQKEIEQLQKEEQLLKKAEQSFYNNNISQDLSFQVDFRPSLKKKQPSTPSDSHDSDDEQELSFEKHVPNKNKKQKSSGSSSSNNNSRNSFEKNKDSSDDDSNGSYGQKLKKKQDKLSSSNSDSDSDNVVDSDDEEAKEEQKNQFNNSCVSRNNNTSIVEVEQSFDAIQQMQKSFCQNKDGKDLHYQPQENPHHKNKKSLNESSQLADVSLDNQSFQSKISVHEHPQKHEQKQYQQRQEKRQQQKQDEEEKNKGEQSKYRRRFVNAHNLCEEDSKKIKELQADLDATLDISSVPGTRGNRGERPQRSEQNNQQQQRGNQRSNRDNNQQGSQRGTRDGNPFLQRRDQQNNTNNSDNWPVSSHEESNNSSFTNNSFQSERIQPVQDGGRNNKRSKRTNY